MKARLLLDLKRQLVERSIPITLEGQGLSMLPYLIPGSRVTLERIAVDRLTPRDIVAMDCGTGWRVHRFCRVESGQIITKGDACSHPDRSRPVGDLVGRVTSARLGPLPWPVHLSTTLCLRLFQRTDPPVFGFARRAVGRFGALSRLIRA